MSIIKQTFKKTIKFYSRNISYFHKLQIKKPLEQFKYKEKFHKNIYNREIQVSKELKNNLMLVK